MDKLYSNNAKLNELIEGAVGSIEGGNSAEGLTAMIKNAPTGILKASSNHQESRYQPGNQLVTYNGIDDDGNPIQETWGGGVAYITEDSVILRNTESIKYTDKHQLAGQEVKGTYQEDGKFVVDQKNGDVTLFNEYVSDVGFVKGAYGVEANEQGQIGFKLQSSYVLEIPTDMENVTITTKSGVEINLTGGDYVVIDTKKDKVTSVHGCESGWLNKTYKNLEDHMKTLQE
tara:strand:+ start:258 stop:947 length:690 start_codon:yes stop_codon:yes gene_type:complete